ncbi:MAG: hypothetical protein IJX99_01120 [Clostridia bacterium]|nr:hypothetical protein [Clostridia bacterium]MBQ8298472.1 hypothetical protein [Clostridia bacterium]
MCKYCEDKTGFTPINRTVDYSGLEISMSSKGMLRCRAYMFKELFETQDVVNINYCPMCGKKLGE